MITVIIVNFNGGTMVLECLRALAMQHYRNFKIVVVDNCSTDTSAEAIALNFSNVHMVRLSHNSGFAGGVNKALSTPGIGEWVALLNPDAYPEPNWLGALVASASLRPEYACFGSKMLSDNGAGGLDGVGDAYHFSGLPWRVGHGKIDDGLYERDFEIFGPCAAAALYSTKALRTVALGGSDVLDEDFFCYVEDVDLAFRMRLAGYRSLYIHSAVVRHVGSGVVGKHSDFQLYHGHRNLVWTYIKNMPSGLFWLFLPAHIALNAITIIWFTLRGRGRVVAQAKWDAMKSFDKFWQKRRKIQAVRSVSAWEILRVLQISPWRH
jgi:GT2 family glycosyltransferase